MFETEEELKQRSHRLEILLAFASLALGVVLIGSIYDAGTDFVMDEIHQQEVENYHELKDVQRTAKVTQTEANGIVAQLSGKYNIDLTPGTKLVKTVEGFSIYQKDDSGATHLFHVQLDEHKNVVGVY